MIADRPSATAIFLHELNVICSGAPDGYFGARGGGPPTSAPKYIHRPSGDHPAALQCPSGPTGCPIELASKGTTRHDWNVPVRSISTMRTADRSADR